MRLTFWQSEDDRLLGAFACGSPGMLVTLCITSVRSWFPLVPFVLDFAYSLLAYAKVFTLGIEACARAERSGLTQARICGATSSIRSNARVANATHEWLRQVFLAVITEANPM